MLRQILADQFRLLAFRRPGPGFATQPGAYLLYGMVVTWLVGIGRYWDHPAAQPWQYAGLGSLAYVLLLALLLWLLCLPLRPQRWRYRTVLLFLAFCSFPALLYAIPVERFLPLDTAQAVNAWFLAIVASWRVALLVVFLLRVAALPPFAVLVATLLPVALIVVALSALNLEHVVFEIMAGIRPEQRSANDLSYAVVWLVSLFAILALPVLAIAYAALVYMRRR